MSKLFEPLQLGCLRLPNRLVRSATGEGAAQRDVGCATVAMGEFYGRLAKGGVGLILSGHTAVSREGRCSGTMSALYEDAFVPAFRKMVEACHAADRPIACQLNHGGRQVNPAEPGISALGPSAVQIVEGGAVPAELSEAEINRLVGDFAAAARRAREAGFDAVQIHSAHGYLISQFNSPLTNCRNDGWGGSPEKRRRFLREIFLAIRGAVGEGYPILVKQNVQDYHPEGLTFAEAQGICHMLEELGVCAIELSGGIAETIPRAFRASQIRHEHEVVFFEDECRELRKQLSCPLILTGGIRRLETGNRLLEEGICDGIGLCRPLIREPDLPKQWFAGRSEAARCISCRGCKSNPERCNYCPHEKSSKA